MRLPLRLIPPNTILHIMQGSLKGKEWIVGSSPHGCWLGMYEYNKQIIFSKIIKEKSIVYDIGAHAGFHSLLFSTLVGPKGRVFAFEPSPRNNYYLKQHLTLNHCDNAEIIEAAVGDKDGITFLEEGPTSGMGHLSTKGNFTVKMVGLDNFVARNEIPPPDFIKINVEGAELKVLIGAQEVLTDYGPQILLSTHSPELHRECRKFLETLNYSLQSIYEDKDIDNMGEFLVSRIK